MSIGGSVVLSAIGYRKEYWIAARLLTVGPWSVGNTCSWLKRAGGRDQAGMPATRGVIVETYTKKPDPVPPIEAAGAVTV